MIKNRISREYFFGVGLPLGITKAGQLPPPKMQEGDTPLPLFSQPMRRGHVQLFFAFLLAFIVVGLTTSNNLVISLLALSLIIPAVLIRISIYSIADLPLAELDEREIRLRENGFATSYKILFITLILITAIAAILRVSLGPQNIVVVGTAMIATSYILPSAVIAWRSRD